MMSIVKALSSSSHEKHFSVKKTVLTGILKSTVWKIVNKGLENLNKVMTECVDS